VKGLPVRVIAIVSIVVAVVPVVLGAPPMLVLIPPAMIATPTIFARFVQLVPSFVRLLALAPMMLDGFMEMMIRLRDAPLASVIIGAQTRSPGEEQKSRQRSTGQRDFSRSKNSRLQFCMHPVLLYVRNGA
jgi:hypothetical protein